MICIVNAIFSKKVTLTFILLFASCLSKLIAQNVFTNDLEILAHNVQDKQKMYPEKKYAHRLLGFYKKFLSSQDGNTCTFSPSCSEFASRCLSKFGFAKALLLTSDRLCRCNNLETDYYTKWSEHDKPVDDEDHY